MKKLLIILLIVLLIALGVFLVITGVNLGPIKVLSFKGIQNENDKLNDSIKQAGKLATSDYKQAVSNVDGAIKQLKNKKTQYEELVTINTDENGKIVGILEEYEYDNLLVKIGNYATKENLVMNLNIVKGNSIIKNAYELNFTLNGSYISIVDFISDIENDSTLGFKIENFQLSPKEGNILEATFITKEVVINDISEISPPIQKEENVEDGEEKEDKDKKDNNDDKDDKDKKDDKEDKKGDENKTDTDKTNSTSTKNTTNSTNTAE